MQRSLNVNQYEAAHKKRTMTAAFFIFVLIPVTIVASAFLIKSHNYWIPSLIILAYTMIPFFMVFEKRKPKAREIVLIATMTALTVCIHLIFAVALPVSAGTAMVIIAGISLGPEAGFLVGSLAKLVCNFYQGQGAWTPWQMFCWGLLGFLAGLVFNKVSLEKDAQKLKSRNFQVIIGPVLCVVFAELAAYVCYILIPNGDTTFIGWRLYVFGAIGLLAGVLLQRKRLPVDNITLTIFTFFAIFIIYGGIMNVCAMVTSAAIPGGAPISASALKILYITGAPYDAAHGLAAAIFMFLFGDKIIRKVERVKIKYGIYRV